MIEWTDLANGNAIWHGEEIRCTVYLKKDTKTSWRWLMSKPGWKTIHCPWTYASKAKAKAAAAKLLYDLHNGISWSEALRDY